MDKESDGRSFFARLLEDMDSDFVTSRSPTNISQPVFEDIMNRHREFLTPYVGDSGVDEYLSDDELWRELGESRFNELALAVTAIRIDELVQSRRSLGGPFADPSNAEWALTEYRFEPSTVQDRIDNGLTAAFVRESCRTSGLLDVVTRA